MFPSRSLLHNPLTELESYLFYSNGLLWTTLLPFWKSTLSRVLVSNSASNSWTAVSPCGLLTAHSFGRFLFKSSGLPLQSTYLQISVILFFWEIVHCQDPELTLAGQTDLLLFTLNLFSFRKDSSSSLLDTQPRFSAMHVIANLIQWLSLQSN